MPKGIGKYSFTMTMFQPGQEALDDFQRQVWDIWRKPSAEKSNGALRISFKIEWTTQEIGAATNEKYLTKERPTFDGKPIENPLRRKRP